MDLQLNLRLPIPIIENIIELSALSNKLTFRVTCKRFLLFTTEHFFPTLVTTLCGSKYGHQDGDFVHVRFNGPYFGVLNASSTILYVSDHDNHVIRKIDLLTNRVMTLCGTPRKRGWNDGVGSEAQFSFPEGLALNEEENLLYISESWNHTIRSVNLIDGRVRTLFGNPKQKGRKDGIGKEATFHFPSGMAMDSISDFLYVADSHNHSIRKIILRERRVETLCGTKQAGYKDGPFESAMFYHPCNIIWNSETQELYVSESRNHVIRILSLKERTVSTLCGTPEVAGYENGVLCETKFCHPVGLGLDSSSQYLYVTDYNQVIRKIPLSKKERASTLCGIVGERGSRDGLFPTFNLPRGIIVDPYSQSLYVLDFANDKVRKIIDRKRTTFACFK